MKSLGIIRKVDALGRIVIPSELRRKFRININDELEIYTEGESIILKKYEPSCVFCGEDKDVFQFCGQNVCHKCAQAMIGYVK